MSTRYIDVVLRARNAMAGALNSARQGFKNWSQSIAGNIAKAAAAYLSFQGVIRLGKAVVSAFTQQQDAVQNLTSALQSHGADVAKLLPLYQQFAARIQDLTGKGDEATLSLIAQLTNYGVMQSQIPRATQMVIGLSKAFKLEEDAAAKLTAQVLQGNFSMVGRYIPATKSAATETEKLRIVMDAAAAGFKQQEAALNTVSGRWMELKGRVGDALEEIGAGAAGTNTMADAIKNLSETIKELTASGDLQDFGRQAADSIGPVAKLMGWMNTARSAVGRGANILGKVAANDKGLLSIVEESINLGKELDMQQALAASAHIARLRAQRKAQEDLNASVAADEKAEQAAADTKKADAAGGQGIASAITSAQSRIQSAAAAMNAAFLNSYNAQIDALEKKEKAAKAAWDAEEKAGGEKLDMLNQINDAVQDNLAKAQEAAAKNVQDFIREKQEGEEAAKSAQKEQDKIDKLREKSGKRGVTLSKRDREFLAAADLRDKAAADLRAAQDKALAAQGNILKEQVRQREAAEAAEKTLADIRKSQQQLLVLKG
jgi:hypothetical protein